MFISESKIEKFENRIGLPQLGTRETIFQNSNMANGRRVIAISMVFHGFTHSWVHPLYMIDNIPDALYGESFLEQVVLGVVYLFQILFVF